jgi:Cu/Ag efflux protein CusF
MRPLALAALFAAVAAGCGPDAPSERALTVRAVYVQPEFEGLAATFDHEAIPDVMDAMRMAFPVAEPALIEDLEPGQKVSLTIAQHPRLEVVAIEALPAETELVLAEDA